MTHKTCSEIVSILAQVAEQRPELRFGQLVANIAYLAKGATQEAIWEVEDQEFLEAAGKHLAELHSQTRGRLRWDGTTT